MSERIRPGGVATRKNSLKAEIAAELAGLSDQALLRSLRTVETLDGVRGTVDGRPMNFFCGNDYLGLAGDPRLGQAALAASERYGFGARASRLISGHSPIHEELEQALARFHRAGRALLFPSGFQGNLAVVTSLLTKGDTVILDRLAHASLVDAARLSGATLKVFPHNDVDALAGILTRVRNRSRNRILVLTESVYSMDGDPAPLRELSEICGEAGALLLVDEAHATGVWGEGRGLSVEAGIQEAPHLIRTGTLSKALGGQGGYLLAGRELRDLLINKGRALIYSTALAPSLCGAGLAALRLVESEPERRSRLWERCRELRGGENPGGPIVPWILGSSEKALAAAQKLWDAGAFVPAIRYPTVGKDQARLRITLSASHGKDQVEGLLQALKALVP